MERPLQKESVHICHTKKYMNVIAINTKKSNYSGICQHDDDASAFHRTNFTLWILFAISFKQLVLR